MAAGPAIALFQDIQAMLRVVAETCEWLGIDINLDKTEISAFDYSMEQGWKQILASCTGCGWESNQY